MKVLLVCESSYKFESGGRVVRFLAKILNSYPGHQLKIVVLDSKRDDYDLDSFYVDNDVVFLPLRKSFKCRMARLLVRTVEIQKFKQIIDDYLPSVVHFASFYNDKPGKFIKESKRHGAKVILQPWTMNFYCDQGFGFRNGRKCNLCVKGNYLEALIKNCSSLSRVPAQLERSQLHKQALQYGDVFLSSNSELDIILQSYGVSKEKITRFPVPFDCSFLEVPGKGEGDYFIFYGQANEHKGLQVLLEVFENLPDIKLKIYPISPLNEVLYNRNNIEVVNGKNWKNGLKEAIINAKAVLIPSLWSTSTEYAMCEALLLKKPVVVFNVGVHRDIFKHKFNAMVAEPHDIDSYRQSIIELDENPVLRNKVAENALKTIVELNDVKQLHLKLIALYQM